MKRKTLIMYLSAALCVCCALAAFGTAAPLWQAAEENRLVCFYEDTEAAPQEVATTENECYGIRFHATGSFKKIEIYVQQVRLSVSRMKLSLYKWDQTYQKTIRSVPVYENTAEGFSRRSYVAFAFPDYEQMTGEGEYLAVFSGFGGNPTLNKYKNDMENVELYFGGVLMGGSLVANLEYGNAPAVPLGTLSEKGGTQANGVEIAGPDTWAATDGLGRTLPDHSSTGNVREEKFVGMFYWTWHCRFYTLPSGDVTQVLREHPEIVHDYKSPLWEGKTQFFWNEPVYGYYNGSDQWVFRKQAELLADAGVDVIIFDNSNGTDTFMEGLLVLLETFAQARADGVRTPQVSFLLPFWDYENVAIQLRELYEKIYSVGKYKELWFYWKGKPLMMGSPDHLDVHDPDDKEIFDFFTYRPCQPSYTTGQEYPGQWGWLSVYPQKVYTNLDGTPEQISVGVAQNHNEKIGLTAMNGENVFGRTYSGKLGGYDTREDAKLYGANFAEQFEYALEVDPEFIFITGWNEWRAGRYDEWCGVVNAFPDTFDDTYSRDIEPSKGDLKDHYYYQMVSYIRRFKGTNPLPAASESKTIDIYSEEDQWAAVSPNYLAYGGNTLARDCDGYTPYHYTNHTGRNDITGAKLTYDQEYLYFMVETAGVLTSPSDPGWMRLFIDVEGMEAANWETFEYVVNRVNPGETAVLERSLGGWNWEEVGQVAYHVSGNRLQIKIPRMLIGVSAADFTIHFKWSDNMQAEGDIMDFYNNGDVAPGGRFKYTFSSGKGSLNPQEPASPERMSTGQKILLASVGAGVLIGAAVGGICIGKKCKSKKAQA